MGRSVQTAVSSAEGLEESTSSIFHRGTRMLTLDDVYSNHVILLVIQKNPGGGFRNLPIYFTNARLSFHRAIMQGLADELSKEGACDKAIFPDTNTVVTTCAMIGNLSVEGVSIILD